MSRQQIKNKILQVLFVVRRSIREKIKFEASIRKFIDFISDDWYKSCRVSDQALNTSAFRDPIAKR